MDKKSDKSTANTPVATVEVKSVKEQTMEALATIEASLTELQTIDDVDALTFSIMDTLPESCELAQRIADARNNGDRPLEALLSEKQRRIYEDIRGELALVAGIETDSSRIERENSEYRVRLLERVDEETLDPDDTSTVLNQLGMIRRGKGGKEIFSYPQGVFPPHIDEKWDHYTDLVAQHVKLLASRQEGISVDPALIAQLDAVRKYGHNNLSLAIKDFLELDGWDLEKCRNLVIKMRDSNFPTIETAEKAVTANEVLRLIASIKRLSAGESTSQI